MGRVNDGVDTTSQQPSGDRQRKDRPRGRANGGRERGPDKIPRGSVTLLYRTVLDDDGTLERSLKGDKSFRARAARMILNAVDDPKTGMPLLEQLGDRLEGKPVQRTEELNPPEIRINLGNNNGEERRRPVAERAVGDQVAPPLALLAPEIKRQRALETPLPGLEPGEAVLRRAPEPRVRVMEDDRDA